MILLYQNILSVREINRMIDIDDSKQLKMAIENLNNITELKLKINLCGQKITLMPVPEENCYIVPVSILIDFFYENKQTLLSSAYIIELFHPISKCNTSKNLDLFKKLLKIITQNNDATHLSLKRNNLNRLTIPDIQSIMQLIPENVQFLDLAYNNIMSSSAENNYTCAFLHTLPDNLRLCHLFDSQFFDKNKIESQLEELKKYDSKYLDLAIEIAKNLVDFENENDLIIDTVYKAVNGIIICQSLEELDNLKSIYTDRKPALPTINMKFFLQVNDVHLDDNAKNKLSILFDFAEDFLNQKIKSPAKSARSVI